MNFSQELEPCQIWFTNHWPTSTWVQLHDLTIIMKLQVIADFIIFTFLDII
jgi:hypothetical protein